MAETATNGDSPTKQILNGAPNGTNGDSEHLDTEVPTTVDEFKQELARVQKEKEELSEQYSVLVGKLNTMRTTVANKLKQDAEELDRREQLVQQLSAENEDLNSTISTLQAELVASNADAERLTSELDEVRSRAYQQGAQEAMMRERELHETRAELERSRIERDDWERLAEQERVLKEEARESVDVLMRDIEVERNTKARLEEELLAEREKTNNLQSVLEDFQAAKDHELRQTVTDLESQLATVTQSLAEYKHRAHTAELRLEDSSADSSKVTSLENEVKEKNLLIGKLRHQAVILNEHLNEALRRLRRQASDRDSAVDRRLVTNILLSFLTAPRGDSKRFEMLKILSDILSWNDAEREKAGLQRAGVASTLSSPVIGRRPSQSASMDLEKTDVTESFSQMWVEFLLTQAEDSGSGGAPPPVPPSPTSARPFSVSSANSPYLSSRTLSTGSPSLGAPQTPVEGRHSGSWIRLPTFGASTSSPPTSEKGKDKA